MLVLIKEIIMLFALLNIIGIMLIILRPDRNIILKDLKKMFIVKKIYLFFTTLILVYFVMIPISIPFSVIQIMNGGDDY
jgi:hypothetical protein